MLNTVQTLMPIKTDNNVQAEEQPNTELFPLNVEEHMLSIASLLFDVLSELSKDRKDILDKVDK